MNDPFFVTVDCETTGLDEKSGQLLEVGIVLADRELNPVEKISHIVRPSGKIKWDELHPTVQEMHGNNGLRAAIEAGEGQGLTWVQGYLMDFLEGSGMDGKPMMGSSIGFDRRWLEAKMPDLEAMFHYRNIDFSSVNELARGLNPRIFAHRPNKPGMHRVIPDCMDTLELARYYADNFFFVSE